MYIEIIKNHSAGIKEGMVLEMKYIHAERMIKEGYAIETTEDSLKEHKKEVGVEKVITTITSNKEVVKASTEIVEVKTDMVKRFINKYFSKN